MSMFFFYDISAINLKMSEFFVQVFDFCSSEISCFLSRTFLRLFSEFWQEFTPFLICHH